MRTPPIAESPNASSWLWRPALTFILPMMIWSVSARARIEYLAARSTKYCLTFAVICMVSLFSRCYEAVAQQDQGAITGVVQDAGGAVIPNAHVTLTDTDTGLVLNTAADGGGIYVFSPVKIGNYIVSATAAGFQTTTQEHVHLNVGERLNITVALKPGVVTQTVTVSTAPPLLQTQSATVGQVVSTQTINTTALNGRNFVYIAQLTAGTAVAEGSRGAGTGDFEANGQDAGQNNYLLDGIDNNVNAIDFLNGASYIVRPPPDALAEFEVTTTNYSAELGHSAGGVVNASIKSGTNQIHGDVWEYFRNTALDARNFNALTVPQYNQNQFGATLGLPIVKNRLFFFGDLEDNRIVFGQTTTETVPTADMKQGNFSELLNTTLTGNAQPIQLYEPNSGGAQAVQCNGQNNVYCASQLDPVASKILALFPSPNTNGNLTYNNYNVTNNSTDNRWSWDTRVDWNISDKDQVFARHSYLNERSFLPPPFGPILDGGAFAADGTFSDLAQQFVASETHVFNPKMTNEFRFSFTYGHFEYVALAANEDVSAGLGLGGIPFSPLNGGLPVTAISGTSGIGTPFFYPADEYQNNYEILDNLTKIIGHHSIKFGAELLSIRFSALQPPYAHGDYNFTGQYSSNPGVSFTGYGVADFLTNQIFSAQLSNSSTVYDNRWYSAGYAQDDWRLTPKVTLNLGVRYDYLTPYKENSGSQANFFATGPLGIGVGTASLLIPRQQQAVPLSTTFMSALNQDHVTLQYVSNPRISDGQKSNFAPRIGISAQIDPKTVIRAGFGIFYGGMLNVGSDNLGFNYPFQFTSTVPAPNCRAGVGNCPSNGLTLEGGFSKYIAEGLSNSVSTPNVYGLRQFVPTGYSQQESFTFQRSLTNDLTASIGYVGSVSRHLTNNENQNDPEALINPGNNSQLVEPFPQFGTDVFLAMEGMATYNALQLKMENRYSNGLSFLATYTWSHTMDDSPNGLGSTGDSGYRNTNLVPILDDYANSPWDTRNRFTFNGFYELPFGEGHAHLNRRGVASLIAGGWSTSLTFAAQTGNPFTVSPSNTTAAGGGARAILIGNPFAPGGSPNATNPGITCPSKVRNKTNWYNPCAFANPLPGSLISPGPNAGNPNQPEPGYVYPEHVTSLPEVLAFLGGRRSQVMGPGYERINMSLFRDFTIVREQRCEFRADIFNVLNTPAYGVPSVATDNSNGGQITSPRFFQNDTPDARFVQFSFKYIF
jgi:outer membrane receptor protein involved in Fe transport